MHTIPLAVLTLLLSLLSALPAYGALALTQTRLIFDADQTAVSLQVCNQNAAQPYLAQGWITDAGGTKIHDPLVLLPPLQRIEPGATTQIRVQALPGAKLLRQDRETLFYLNLREIPPATATPNQLTIALQNRIKIFWRPVALKAPAGVLVSPWVSKLQLHQEGEHWRIYNPGAYYITLIDARAQAGQATISGFTPVMLPPGGQALLPVRIDDYGHHPQFTYINDFGGQPVATFECQSTRCAVTANAVPSQ